MKTKMIIMVILIFNLVLFTTTACTPQIDTKELTNSNLTKNESAQNIIKFSNTLSNENAVAKDQNQIEIPNRIIFYKKGEIVVINKDDTKYQKTIDLTNIRVKSITDSYKSIISQSDMDMMMSKGSLLEFDYSSIHVFKYNSTYNNDEFKVSYKKLYFPLDSVSNRDYTTFMIVIGDKEGTINSSPMSDAPIIMNGGGPCEIKVSPTELLNYLNS
jgi:hypothetical protein